MAGGVERLSVWEVVAFLSELGALAALAYWGIAVPDTAPLKVLAGAGLPLLAAVLWGMFAAPRAPVRRTPLVVATKVLVYGGATAALAATDHPVLAAVLALAGLLGSLLSRPGPAVTPPPRP